MKYYLGWLLILLCSTVAPAWAEGANKPLKIITENWAPFSYEERGEVKGIITHIIRKVFRDMHVPVTFEVMPWRRAVMMLKHGNGDALYSASYKAERETFLIYPKNPIYQVRYVFYSLKGSGFIFDGDMNHLQGKIGAIRGYSYTPEFWSTPRKCKGNCYKIEEVGRLEHNFKKLKRGEIIAFPASQKVAEAMIRKEGYDISDFNISEVPLATKDYFLTFRKGTDPVLIRDFDQTIEKIISKQRLPFVK